MSYANDTNLTATTSTSTVCEHNSGWYDSVPFIFLGIELGRTNIFCCEECYHVFYGKEYKKIRNR